MRQKAHEHYDKRLARIDSKLPSGGESNALPDELPDAGQSFPEIPPEVVGSQLADSAPAASTTGLADSVPSVPTAGQRLTGRENALSRRLLNEERKLAHQTELAERLREIAEEQGDVELYETADRLEQQALDRFDKHMDAISSFQERHRLALDD
jgi:hypothetical protein